MRIFVLALCLLAAIPSLQAQTLSPAKPLVEAEPTRSREYPKMQQNAAGTMVVCYLERNGATSQIYTTVSKDAGATWSMPMKANTVATKILGYQRQPRTALSNDGTLHMVWTDQRPSSTQVGTYYSRSTDDGATWTMRKLISDTNDTRYQDFSYVAVDDLNNVYITYLSSLKGTSDGYEHVFLRTSTDTGVTWSAERRVDAFPMGGSCECCQQQLRVTAEGHVYVVFRSNISNRRDVWLARSMDRGVTFEEPILIQSQPWNIPMCPTSGPSIVLDSYENAHISWQDSRDAVKQPVVYYAKLPFMSRATPVNVDLSSKVVDTGTWPEIAIRPDGGAVSVVYESRSGSQYALSTDGGDTFTSTDLTDQLGFKESLSIVWSSAGRPFMAWQGARGSYYDVFTAEDLGTPSSVPAVVSAGQQIVVLHADATISTRPFTSTLRLCNMLGQELCYTVVSQTQSTLTLALCSPAQGPVFVTP
jgi:hypothetical protein